MRPAFLVRHPRLSDRAGAEPVGTSAGQRAEVIKQARNCTLAFNLTNDPMPMKRGNERVMTAITSGERHYHGSSALAASSHSPGAQPDLTWHLQSLRFTLPGYARGALAQASEPRVPPISPIPRCLSGTNRSQGI
jgi:hypothetical protein